MVVDRIVALCGLSKCEDKAKRQAIGQWAMENGGCFIYSWQHPLTSSAVTSKGLGSPS